MKAMESDSLALGLVIGLLGPLFGFLVFGMWYAHEFNTTIGVFVRQIFLANSAFRAPVASVSLAMNGVIFYIFSRGFKAKTMKGMLIATFLYVPVILYLYFA